MQGLRTFQVVAKRFFDDYPPPAMILIEQLVLTKVFDDVAKLCRTDGQIKSNIPGKTIITQGLHQAAVTLWLRYVNTMIIQALTKTFKQIFIQTIAGSCINHIPHFRHPFLPVPGTTAYGKNTRPLRKPIVQIQMIKSRYQFNPCEIARSTKDNESTWFNGHNPLSLYVIVA